MKVVGIDRWGEGFTPFHPQATFSEAEGYYTLCHGESGRGRKQVVIPVLIPPTDDNSPVMLGGNYTLVTKDDVHILRPTEEEDNEFLILLSPHPGHRGGASYEILGEASLLAEGYSAQGAAGRAGGGPCPIIRAHGDCAVRWERWGNLYGTPPLWECRVRGGIIKVLPVGVWSRLDAVSSI